MPAMSLKTYHSYAYFSAGSIWFPNPDCSLGAEMSSPQLYLFYPSITKYQCRLINSFRLAFSRKKIQTFSITTVWIVPKCQNQTRSILVSNKSSEEFPHLEYFMLHPGFSLQDGVDVFLLHKRIN